MRTQYISDFENFQSFQNCSWFSTFCLLRNFYSGGAQHANYGNQFKSSFPTLRTLSIWDLQCFQTFRNGCLFCTLCLIRNFYSGHEQPINYGKHSLNDHYQHCAPCAYDIYIIFKVFEMAGFFAHFGLFEISTPVRRIMLTIANTV